MAEPMEVDVIANVNSTTTENRNPIDNLQVDDARKKIEAMDISKSIKEADIVILDDEKATKKTRRKSLKLGDIPEVTEVIDLVPSKTTVNTKCINYACTSGKEMVDAPVFCLSYYRVKSTDNKKKEVCIECFNLAFEHYDTLAGDVVRGEYMINRDLPLRNELVEIDDSDSDTDGDEEVKLGYNASNLTFLKNNFEEVFSNTIMKYKLEDQVKYTQEKLTSRVGKLSESFQEVGDMLRNIQKRLDGVYSNLYGQFKTPYREVQCTDIIDIGSPTAKPMIRTILPLDNKREPLRHSPRNVKPVSYAELDDPGSSNSPGVFDVKDAPPDLPTQGPLFKPPLKIGEQYYAVRPSGNGTWGKVRLVAISPPGSLVDGVVSTQAMYSVQVESKQKTVVSQLLNGKEIAYGTSSPVQLEVGTRVIAIFKEAATVGEIKKTKRDSFYPGVVAEPLSNLTKYRYLIFFDDGYAQYVHYGLVHVIFKPSKDVWDDVSVDSRAFIKQYLETYPNKRLVKLRKDQTVRTEHNGKWWLSTVMSVDCSLVQIFFDAISRNEWIYRGSTRLNPMFREEQAARSKVRTTRNLKNQAEPYVQYSRDDVIITPVRSVAKKSTAKTAMINKPLNINNTPVPFLPAHKRKDEEENKPPASKVVYFTPRKPANMTTVYRSHICSPACKEFKVHHINTLDGYNPLSKPLLCGWNRVTYKYKNTKKEINYKAPCGRFIRNMHELHTYLQLIKSDMTVDLFDFDSWVHCLAEYVLEHNIPLNKDLSSGLERVPIPVVNYNDRTQLDFCNYSIERAPMEGVNLNLDPEFLCGCDCDDDCQDKLKCSCWQLTLEGVKYITKDMSLDEVGYRYRRLPEAVITGIYECNSRCKCGPTCLNRVVQNPLQLKLQVFKTSNRGWGIRCLNDVPQGAFICIYAGSMLTEQMANEGGKNYGDEYLAELDYIEVVEKAKEDYEADALTEDESNDSKPQEESGDEDEGRKNPDGEDRDFMPGYVPTLMENAFVRTRARRRTDTKVEVKVEVPKVVNTDDDEAISISDDDEVREPSSFIPKNSTLLDEEDSSKYTSVRTLYGKDEAVYVMDANVTGNIGRFLNHSCEPNVFVQNVFVDTHDPRFPWVSFFSSSYIRAGTELTWNYNYDVGSVPGKVLICRCSSSECRGRLL